MLPKLTMVTAMSTYQRDQWTRQRLRKSSRSQTKKSHPSQIRGDHSDLRGAGADGLDGWGDLGRWGGKRAGGHDLYRSAEFFCSGHCRASLSVSIAFWAKPVDRASWN